MLYGGRKLTALEACTGGLVSQVLWPTTFMQEVIPRVQSMVTGSLKVGLFRNVGSGDLSYIFVWATCGPLRAKGSKTLMPQGQMDTVALCVFEVNEGPNRSG